MTTPEENKRIAALTTGAIKTTTETAIKAMLDAVEAAEAKTREMREAAEKHIAEFKRVTEELAGNVSDHVIACQSAIDTFNKHHLTILNVEPKEPPHGTDAGISRVKQSRRHEGDKSEEDIKYVEPMTEDGTVVDYEEMPHGYSHPPSDSDKVLAITSSLLKGRR